MATGSREALLSPFSLVIKPASRRPLRKLKGFRHCNVEGVGPTRKISAM